MRPRLLSLLVLSALCAPSTTPTPPHARAIRSFGNLPLTFEANHGQIDSRVRFLARGSGYSSLFTSTEMVLSFGDTSTRRATLRMMLAGANPNRDAAGADKRSGVVNYFIGRDPRAWRTHVPTYAAVRYDEVYPGVDLVYYGNQRQLEYDFVVAPGADPAAIAVRFDGTEGVALDDGGDLILRTAAGDVRQRKPIAYQEIDGSRHEVAVAYALENDGEIAFRLGPYDRESTLVIDPVLFPTLSYSTFLGGSSGDTGYGIAVDSFGNAYVSGRTFSVDFPTAGAAQPACSGSSCYDAFVAKLSADGSTLVYATFLGGSLAEEASDIAVDGAGNAYVTGITGSTDFPTVNAFQPTCTSCPTFTDAFVTRLSASGSALDYSTYLGGSNLENFFAEGAIAVDALGSAYVTGETHSADFPTVNALQPLCGQETCHEGDAFVTKLSPSGTSAVYSTYLGGLQGDSGYDIAVDALGSAYIAGRTFSTNFPTASPVQPAKAGHFDAFIAKLNAAGSALVYSTYFGGSDEDIGVGIAVDGSGSAHVTGETLSTDFPTANAVQPTLGGGAVDAFAMKLDPTGSTVVYSTYLGGSGFENGTRNSGGIAVDASGNAYVIGRTSSADFPTVNPLQSTLGHPQDAFVTKIDPLGTSIVYSTYLGGNGLDIGNAIAVDSSGAYVTGENGSSDFPSTPNAFQPTSGGGDAFVTKIVESPCPVLSSVGPANIWIGLANSDDVGIRFDLLAEVYKDGSLAAAGQVESVAGGSSGFNNANQHTIALTPSSPTIGCSGDTLSIKVFVRNACVGSGKNSGRARLWYNDAAADSRFDATIAGPETYYLRSGFALGTAPGAGPKLKVDVQAGAKCSPFKSFGEWSTTLP